MKRDIEIENQIKKIVEDNPNNYIKVIKSKGFMGRYENRQKLVDYIDSVTKDMCDSDFKYSLKTKIYWVINNIDSWDNDLVCCKNDHIPIKEWNIKELGLGYKKGCCKECERTLAQKSCRDVMLRKYGVANSFQLKSVINKLKKKRSQIQAKRYQTRKNNNTLNSSLQEDAVFYFLCQKHGFEDVIRQFSSDRYPFACDFYVKSLDLYIECNFGWTHGGHWYDENSEKDKSTLNSWRRKGTSYFDNAIETWTKRDVEKRRKFTDNNLNFKIYWTIEEALKDITNKDIQYTKKGNLIFMSKEEANDAFLTHGEEAFNVFKKEYEFPYPKFDKETAINELNKLKNCDLSDKYPSFCIRTMFKSRYSCIHRSERSPVKVWQDLKSGHCLEDWKSIYVNRLRNDCSLDGNEFRNTGIPTAKVVLSGINVSGLSKIPTYLKPHLAKRLIKKHLDEFDQVFCPFNGFGGIMLGATIGCGKSYIGQDINKNSIEETTQLIDFIKMNFDSGIQAKVGVQDIFTDINKSFQCLFACPPYIGKDGKNIEMWNFDDNMKNIDAAMSCDQWIDQCIERYSCKRYLFVVDDKIKKYRDNIVEQLVNRSHFGTNAEYVVCIDDCS